MSDDYNPFESGSGAWEPEKRPEKQEETTPGPESPKTGDSGLLIWWFVLLGAATVLLAVRKLQEDATAQKID